MPRLLGFTCLPRKKGELWCSPILPAGERHQDFLSKDLPNCRLELLLTPPELQKGDTQKQGLDNPVLRATSFY
jgi:hypothetical protein